MKKKCQSSNVTKLQFGSKSHSGLPTEQRRIQSIPHHFNVLNASKMSDLGVSNSKIPYEESKHENYDNEQMAENYDSSSHPSDYYTEEEESESDYEDDSEKLDNLYKNVAGDRSANGDYDTKKGIGFYRGNSGIDDGKHGFVVFKDQNRIERKEQTVIQNARTIHKIVIRNKGNSFSEESHNSDGECTPNSYISNSYFGIKKTVSKNYGFDYNPYDEGIVEFKANYIDSGSF